MTYEEFSSLPSSEKVVLCRINARKMYKLFTVDSGSVYVRSVDHFVTGVREGEQVLSEHTDTDLGTGEWYFDATNKLLYVRMTDSSDPKTKEVVVTHQFFYSTRPSILPFDLDEGTQVEWEGRIESIGALGQQLDDENTGIVLESQSSINLINSDGYFADIFDTLIWENQDVELYSWSPKIPASEAYKLFSGVVESKSYTGNTVVFKLKDFVFKLKNLVNLGIFSGQDGTITDATKGTPKRRIYGQIKQLPCTGIDCVVGGFSLTGTIDVTSGSASVSGTGTSFLAELSPGDDITFTIQGTEYKAGIESISSNSALTLSREAEASSTGVSATVSPAVPYRDYNRRWHIAGHKLRAPSAEITWVYSSNRLGVDTVGDFRPGDSVKINSEYVTIRRISGNQVVLNSALSPAPDVGDTMTKNPVSKVYFKDKELVIDRDWTLTNVDEAILELDELAEFNIAEPRSVGVNLVFTNASRSITTAATIDLRTILKPRDWVRKNSVTDTTYHEILDVKEQSITLRTPYSGTTQTTSALYKSVDIISDDSLITVNCVGMEEDGQWIRTAAQAVRHLVLNDAGFSSVNEDSFDEASDKCGFTLALAIPRDLGSKAPEIKSVITMINESVFGSLYGNSSWDISYSILNSERPPATAILEDHDILDYSVQCNQKIVNAVKINYCPFTDIYTGSSAFEVYQKESDFVNSMVGILNTDERTIYLYEESAATIIGQRILLFNSLSTSRVTVKGKLNLATTSVNDKMYLNLERMYTRFGGRDARKIGVVTGVKKDGLNVDVDFIDLGGIYNRVPSIGPNTMNDYGSATDDEVVRYGFILDNDTLTPDVSSEVGLGNNLIG